MLLSIHKRLFTGVFYKVKAGRFRDYNISKHEWVLDGEGNTRTTAIFTIKYLNSLGFDVNNEPFEKNSWYFRNALVRANYTNIMKK